jgi:hypothetical protein
MWYFILIIFFAILFGDTSSSTKKEKDYKNSSKEDNPHRYIQSRYWESLRNKVMSRDGYKCTKCGGKEHLNVHHIRPIYLEGTDDINNLITLCRDCHQSEHGFKFDDKREGIYSAKEKSQKTHQKPNKKVRQIENAIKTGKCLDIKYKSERKEITTRTIIPKEIFIENSRIYLKSFCYLRSAKRTFRVSRIQSLTDSNKTPDINLVN